MSTEVLLWIGANFGSVMMGVSILYAHVFDNDVGVLLRAGSQSGPASAIRPPSIPEDGSAANVLGDGGRAAGFRRKTALGQFSRDMEILFFFGTVVRAFWSLGEPVLWSQDPFWSQKVQEGELVVSLVLWLTVVVLGVDTARSR